MPERDVVKVQNNRSILLTLSDLDYLNIGHGDYVIKLRDKNKHGKKYIAIYVPDADDDLKLVEFQKLRTRNLQGVKR